ncbi:MAG: urease accessory protein UreE [Muribaculaceae bacterium]|nr:urease accessory protein UreE [Muribaculaceae bacterium]
MEVITEIIGNIHQPEWAEKIKGMHIETIFVDQWTAQKSRFLVTSDHGNEYPIALKRGSRVADGDIVFFDPENNNAAILRLDLSNVLVIDLSGLKHSDPLDIMRVSVELGHAIGNQHWPAVVKETKVYVPLTVDKKVMLSVMETHHIEGISYDFQPGTDVIPYLAPHEIRRLFGGASHESHSHVH